MTPDAFHRGRAPDPSPAHYGDDDAARMLAALAALSTTPVSSAPDQIQAYLALACRLLGVRTAFVSCFTPESLYIVDVATQDGCTISPTTTHRMEEIFCQYVRTTGAPIVIPDASHDVRVQDLPSRQDFGIGAYLGVPLLLPHGELYGTVCALDPDPRPFSPLQIDVLRLIAAQLARFLDPVTVTPSAVAPTPALAPRAPLDDHTFVDVVTHDLRSPLMSVLGFTDLLLHAFGGPLTEDQRDMLTRIRSSAQFMNRLVNDLYDIAVLETGALMLVTEAFDPLHLATDALAVYRPVAEAKHLTLTLTSTSVPPAIVGDRDRLRQILHNFLGNACRYTEVGTIHLHIEGHAETITVQVRDTGPGIPPDARDRIWEKGQRMRREGHGLGVGLYIVRQLATAMGGTVGVDSTLGVGSSFWVRLPLHGPSPQPIRGTW